MVKQLRSPRNKRFWGAKLVIGMLMMGLVGVWGELITFAEEEKQKEAQKPKAETTPSKAPQMGTVKLVDVDNYTKMRILRTKGNRVIKLVVEDLPIQTFGMSNYEIFVDAHSSQEAQASLPEGRYPAKIYRRHKEYDEALNIRLNEVDDSSKPKAIFIDIKPNTVTVVRCRAQDYGEIRYEVLTEE